MTSNYVVIQGVFWGGGVKPDKEGEGDFKLKPWKQEEIYPELYQAPFGLRAIPVNGTSGIREETVRSKIIKLAVVPFFKLKHPSMQLPNKQEPADHVRRTDSDWD